MAVPQIQRLIESSTALPTFAPTTVVIASPTRELSKPTATSLPTRTLPKPSPTPDLFEYFAEDIKKNKPGANVSARALQEIADKIPTEVPFVVKEGGLAAYPATGKVLETAEGEFTNLQAQGFVFISWGHGKITADGVPLPFEWKEANVYLVIVVGKSQSATTLRVADYAAGHAYLNYAAPARDQSFPTREIINKPWLSQQLWWASDSGVNTITLSIWDIATGVVTTYTVAPTTYQWARK